MQSLVRRMSSVRPQLLYLKGGAHLLGLVLLDDRVLIVLLRPSLRRLCCVVAVNTGRIEHVGIT